MGQTPAQKIAVTSATLKDGEAMPKQHTPDGRNDSPSLAWSGVPASTRELAVVCEVMALPEGYETSGNYAMCGKAYDPRFIFAWPTAQIAEPSCC